MKGRGEIADIGKGKPTTEAWRHGEQPRPADRKRQDLLREALGTWLMVIGQTIPEP